MFRKNKNKTRSRADLLEDNEAKELDDLGSLESGLKVSRGNLQSDNIDPVILATEFYENALNEQTLKRNKKNNLAKSKSTPSIFDALKHGQVRFCY